MGMNLDKIALDYVEHYASFRHTFHATLPGFALHWDASSVAMVESRTSYGENPYYRTFRDFFESVKITYKAKLKPPGFRVPGHNPKANLFGEVLPNYNLVREAFLAELSEGEVKDRIDDMLFERVLIGEATNALLDFCTPEQIRKTMKDDPRKLSLIYFLRRYDIKRKKLQSSRARTAPKLSYRPLYQRLLRTEGAGEEGLEKLFGLRVKEFDHILGQRLPMLYQDIQAGDLERQERIGLIEFLQQEGSIGLLEVFGINSYDILVAIHGPANFPEEARARIGTKSTVRKDLGVCRKAKKPAGFDPWDDQWVERLYKSDLKRRVYDRDTVVQRILQNEFFRPYLTRLDEGENPGEMVAQLRSEHSSPDNWLHETLTGYALRHLENMVEISTYPEIASHLRIMKIKSE